MIHTSNININGKTIFKEADAVPVATPSIYPNGGSYSTVQISITTPTAGANIYYTLDGSSPTNASALYNSPFSLLSSTNGIKAIAYHAGMSPSQIATSDAFTILSAANWMTESVLNSNNIITDPSTFIAQNGWLTYNGNTVVDITSDQSSFVAGSDNSFMVWQNTVTNNIISAPTTYIQGT